MKNRPTIDASSPLPLYYQVKKKIINEILRKNLQKGDRIPKEIDMCATYDVSRITIRRAISELVSEKVLYRISGVGTFVDEVQDGDFLLSEKERQVALVVPDIEDLAISAIFSGIQTRLHDYEHEVIIYSSGRRIDKENTNLSHLLQSNSAGAIIFPNWGNTNVAQIFELKRRNFPFVLIDRYFHDLETDYVVTDNIAGAFKVVSHLIALGHRRIGFIGGLDNSAANDRKEGYIRALSEHGIVLDQSLITTLDKDSYSFPLIEPEHGGYEEVRKLMKAKKPPTAIFAASDGFALGAMSAIRELGLRIPQDVAVAGFDNLKYASLLEVPLTTVAQPFREIGEKAVEILMNKIQNKNAPPQKLILAPELIVRKSCGASLTKTSAQKTGRKSDLAAAK
ncbi:MAG TPA: GntR family transcriptional regulator [Lentisphaeria bacterium]|nr:GntR family transcriptional regulator [Lentisphaeria bacterium]